MKRSGAHSGATYPLESERRSVTSPGLGQMAWPDVGSPILLLPVGSCEQHGPHLPLHTDTVIATGGLAAVIAPETDILDVVDPDLTLHGLRYLYELNADLPAVVAAP